MVLVSMPISVPQREEEILAFWKERGIFQKSLQKDSPKGEYVFYDGPPFATGLPHYGHIVASLMKDIIPRFFTMRGYHVDRRWGWDCHGLPIENIIEQEEGFHSKKDIEAFGVDRFNEACRSKVLLYRKEWRRTIERLGRWVDMDNDYKTMDRDYMESIWWVFQELWKRGLIYEDYKSMHICPRCETTLSQSEVAEGYRTITDQSVVAKFAVKPGQKCGGFETDDQTYILAWTTTPWTLPGNVALAVGGDIEYAVIRFHDDQSALYILAKDRIQEMIGDRPYDAVSAISGSDMEGISYIPLFDYFTGRKGSEWDNAWKVYAADFVSLEEGTGIVHIAPAFGEEDFQLAKEKKLPLLKTVHPDGRFSEDVADFAGCEVKPKRDPSETDGRIVAFLEEKGSVFAVIPYEHSYPHCWRCETPLLNYATSSWFVAVTRIKDTLLKTAEYIHWVPAHIKEGRFGKWLEGAKDWAISRQRFWGSVLPIWRCGGSEGKEGCGEIAVIGSVEELEEKSGTRVDDLHKHVVDAVTFPCPSCGGVMRRIPDVLDCWFESGSMPYAQVHYPFEQKEKFEQSFPAQFIAEGVDQTRAWFYYLHVLAGALRQSPAFQNVIVNGIVLAEDGRKMSKRLKNYPEPDALFEQYGADAVRYYLASSPVMRAEDLRFSEREVAEVFRKVVALLFNTVSFYEVAGCGSASCSLSVDHVLDRWIAARLSQTIREVTRAYEQYDINRATRPLRTFVADLSTWYVRRSRKRMRQEGGEGEHACGTFRFVLREFAKIAAPVIPFTAEHVYQTVKGSEEWAESVHLEPWPDAIEGIDEDAIITRMEEVRRAVELALAQRAAARIPVRQPLAQMRVVNAPEEWEEALTHLIAEEVNVKHVSIEAGAGEMEVVLDTEITPELRREGLKREIVRNINALRKKAGMTIHDQIVVAVEAADNEVQDAVSYFNSQICEDVIAVKVSICGERPDGEWDYEGDMKAGEGSVRIYIKKENG